MPFTGCIHADMAIPNRYHYGMTKQIAVRLPDDLVDFLDELVASGDEASRASIVTRALKREKRRLGALRDVEILKRLGPDDDMNSLARFAGQVPQDID
jgi:Arc/MetJ-type ribon-helix-helix transcriptional regulator